MKKMLFAMLVLAINVAFAQEGKGIHFEHAASWKAAMEQAKAENKYIFMDAFTTWCGPCKMMAKNIFPLPEVGDFFNANYINLKVQLDTTGKDDDEIKNWYADAHFIMNHYKVNAFPTYLFFSPDGKLVHRAVGSSEAGDFIATGKNALDPNKQYFTLVAQYDAGERSPALLKAAAEAAMSANDNAATRFYSDAYLKTQKDLLTEDNIRFIDLFTQSTKDTGFAIILENGAAFNKILGEGRAKGKIKNILLGEEIFPLIFGSETKPDWVALQASTAKKHPALASELIGNAKVIYYNNTGDWPAFSAAVTNYLNQFGSQMQADALNNYAWVIFENCSDVACITQALKWSKTSVERTNNPMFMDTYANLLYKNGKKDLAIKWQQKAIKLLKENKEDYAEYEDALNKMKKGKKTW